MKPKFTKDEKRIIKETNKLIKPFGCEVVGLGPLAVGVMGDARSVGVAIEIKIIEDVDISMISTMITNKVKGVARVLLSIELEIAERDDLMTGQKPL